MVTGLKWLMVYLYFVSQLVPVARRLREDLLCFLVSVCDWLAPELLGSQRGRNVAKDMADESWSLLP